MAGIIHVLDSETIDKIAAGEVVEKPASVVKELVENAIDAGADKIAVEIKEGGISLIRVTDNGCGIAKEDLEPAFMRHATSKITNAEDLNAISSLGFRGEALSSISAVSQVEMITKKREDFLGIKVCCNGGTMEDMEEIGAPDGTTILVRNLFYNTPVRKKFLHTSTTEGSYVFELMQHIALSHPEIAISFIQNGQTRFFTSGNGNLSDVIYRIYGKDVANHIIPVQACQNGIQIEGFIGKTILGRANRNYETFFVNGRYIKSKIISSAVEEGYKTFLMQHKYPFAILHFTVNGEDIDVNVHPTKMEIRIMDPVPFCEFVKETVKNALNETVLIREYQEENPSKESETKENSFLQKEKERAPEPFEEKRIQRETQPTNLVRETADYQMNKILGNAKQSRTFLLKPYKTGENIIKQDTKPIIKKVEQMELFSTALEDDDNNRLTGLKIIGQVFDTYWIVEFEDSIYFVDQHAAHEKVNYESFVDNLKQKKNTTQLLMPPIIVSLSSLEMNAYQNYQSYFSELGFEIEPFGGDELSIRGIPMDLYGNNAKDLFLTVLDELIDTPVRGTPDVILLKIASMSCKASVKGNQKMSYEEAKALLKQLFALDNPYHCPHGRPTMFSMSRQELEKKFKRIV
ncbi:MAG: DNA mismatch repair endonuclease MutL [Lachnospiraceae bacterium]|nr:DNA mismatch repair endonuclease MutL [Lachnospiraceae bacterium]